MPVIRNRPNPESFNRSTGLPFELRLEDIALAMQDVYDFFFDVNTHLVAKGLERLDDMVRPAIMSGLMSDMLTSSIAKPPRPMNFTEVYLGQVVVDDFRKNSRGELGTRTATLHALGIAKLRQNWIYRV